MGQFFHCGLGSFGLLGGKFADGGEESRINRASIEEECTEYLEDASFVSGIDGIGVVGQEGVLGFGPVGGLLPGVWGVFWFGRGGMLEALEGAVDTGWHGNVTRACDVVAPFESESAVVAGAGPIRAQFVLGCEGGEEVVGVVA